MAEYLCACTKGTTFAPVKTDEAMEQAQGKLAEPTSEVLVLTATREQGCKVKKIRITIKRRKD